MANLEQELIALKGRVEQLEATVGRLAGTDRPMSSLQPGEAPDPERLKAWLKAQGLVSDVPPLAHEYAARWRMLPEEEKQAIQQELDHLPAGPMASDIIIEGRR